MKLLVPLDGSPLGEAILAPVATAAAGLRADVILLTVGKPEDAEATPRTRALPAIFPVAAPSGSRLAMATPAEVIPHAAEDREQAIERLEASLKDYLANCAARLPGLAVQTRVLISDDPARTIIDVAREEAVDWIAMTTHGRSGISRLLAGSVANAVIRSGIAPVLVVHPTEPAAGH